MDRAATSYPPALAVLGESCCLLVVRVFLGLFENLRPQTPQWGNQFCLSYLLSLS